MIKTFPQSLCLSLVFLIAGTISAHATILQFNATPHTPIILENAGPGNSTVYFNVLNSNFTFDTISGVGTLNATMMNVDDTWQMTGIFQNVSYVNFQTGFNPMANKDLYFQNLIGNAISPNPSNWYGTPNAPAIVFGNQNLTLTATNVVGVQDYNGETDLIGMDMAGYQAWIYWQQFGPDPDGDLTLSFWCHTNQHEWCGDQYWDLKGNPGGSSAIPEPATMALMGMGLIGFGLRKRNKK